MTIVRDGPAPSRHRPGPKPRGRTVVPLTITVTPVQRTALEVLADSEQSSISKVVRRFIAAGLAAGGLLVLTTLTEIVIPRRGAYMSALRALWAAKEPTWMRKP